MEYRETAAGSGAAHMSDAELSQTLGRYQRQAALWRLLGLLGVVCGLIAFFAVPDRLLKTILVAILFFGGICCVLFLGGAAQKRAKTLLAEQLGDFFRAEWEQRFGAEQHTPAMRMDRAAAERLQLAEGAWEECEVTHFHEGSSHGIPFSAANVRLEHRYECGTIQDGRETRHETVFRGLLLRCTMQDAADPAIRIHARTEQSPRGFATGNAAFDRRYCATSQQDGRALLTPQLTNRLLQAAECVGGQLSAVLWEGNSLLLAIETAYVLADVAEAVDLSDLDAVRRSYRDSLQRLERLLALLA